MCLLQFLIQFFSCLVLSAALKVTFPNPVYVVRLLTRCIFCAVGMVLVRTEAGQLVLVPQQVLAQAKAQNQTKAAVSPTPATTTTGATIRLTAPVQQVCDVLSEKEIRQNSTFPYRRNGTLYQLHIQWWASFTWKRFIILCKKNKQTGIYF